MRPNRRANQKVGALGEQFVAQLLHDQGWLILQQRWHCRWGEIDVIAQSPPPVKQLIFVEVKVRGAANWDQAGLLSITPQKQKKLILAAQTFLSEHASFQDYSCRFDVALVSHQKKPCEPYHHDSQGLGLTTLQASPNQNVDARSFAQANKVDEELPFLLRHYIQGAFNAE